MSQPDTNTNATCAKCGTEIQPGVKFCPNCGRAANQAPSKAAAAAKQYAVALKDIALRLWAKAGSYKHGKALVVAGVCVVVLFLCVPKVLPGLAGPKGTAIPRGEPYETILEKIAPAFEKLSQDDQEMLDWWLRCNTVTVRQVNQARGSQRSSGTGAQVGASVGGLFGALVGGLGDAYAEGKRMEAAQSIEEKLANGVPRGMTIGKAIAEQKKYEEKQRLEALDEEKLTAKLKAENEATIEAMRQAVTVKLLSKKKVTEHGSWGSKTDYLVTNLALQNNIAKDVSGIVGTLAIVDQFGKTIVDILSTRMDSQNVIKNSEIIKAGATAEFLIRQEMNSSGRITNGKSGDDDANRFLSLLDDQFKLAWEPMMVIFADGSKLIRKTDSDISREVNNTVTREGHTLMEIGLTHKYSYETQEYYKKQYADRRAAIEEMRQALPVRLLSKNFNRRNLWWGNWQGDLVTNFAFQNNSGKDITGVKGNIRFEDQFGKNILPDDGDWRYHDGDNSWDYRQYVSGIRVLIEKTIRVGAVVELSHKGSGYLESFASMKDFQFKVIWEPKTVVFADGTKIDAPPEPDSNWVSRVYGDTKH